MIDILLILAVLIAAWLIGRALGPSRVEDDAGNSLDSDRDEE